MEIDLLPLNTGISKEILIDEVYSFNKDMLANTDILKLDNVKVKGKITKDILDKLFINIIVKGTMILPCALTLKPTPYDFNIKIEGNLEEMLEEFDENFKNNQKTLDILPIIWENILMEIPMRVVSGDLQDFKTKGDGWELVADEEKVNPSLAKLKDLL